MPGYDRNLAAECAAKARSARFRSELAEKAGGMLTRTDVAKLLGMTPAAVDKEHQLGQILGVSCGGEVCFPAVQFSDGAVLPGLEPKPC